MGKVNNPHNNFFIKSFSVKEVAKGYLKEFLDKEIVQELDLDNYLKLQSDSFITNKLEERYADLVYKCRFKQKKKVKGKDVYEYLFICLLFEHKSYPVKFPYLQLLSYQVNAWEKMESQKEPLRLVLPIVVYHGEKKWHHKPMTDFFHLPNEHFRRFLPIFDYVLTDLSVVSEKRIMTMKDNAMLLNALMALKYARNTGYVEAHLSRILAYSDKYFNTDLGKNYFDILFVYINETVNLKPEKIYEIMTTLPQDIKEQTLSTYQQILKLGREEGVEQGIEQGIEQGREEGMEQGIEQGREEGIEQNKVESTRNMLAANVSDSDIMKFLSVSQEFIDDVRKNRHNE